MIGSRHAAAEGAWGSRGVRFTMVGLGVVVFAFAGRMLWDQLGSRTALVVSVAFAVVLAIDVLVAWTALRRPVIHVEAPDRAYVGEPVALRVVVHGVPRPVVLSSVSMRAPSPVVVVPASRRDVAVGDLVVEPPVRGILARVIVELVVTGPLGLFTTHRRVAAGFGGPLVVAPRARTAEVGLAAVGRSGVVGEPSSASHTSPGSGPAVLRGVRPYVPGDPRRSVHWPATARLGALAVQQRGDDVPPPDRAVVVLQLTEAGPDSEAAVARARGAVEQAWRNGTDVVLVTRAAPQAGLAGFDPEVLSPRRRAVRVAQPRSVGAVPTARLVRGDADLHRRLAEAEVGEIGEIGPGSPPGEPPASLPGGPPSGGPSDGQHGSEVAWWVRSDGPDGWAAAP